MRRATLALACALWSTAALAAAEAQRPFTAGHAFVHPAPPDAPLPSRAELDRMLAALTSPTSPVEGELPAGLRGNAVQPPPGCIGRPRLYQYTNGGVQQHQQYNSCGQAAMATVLTGLELEPEDPTNAVMQGLYDRFPPDILWGKFGTSFKQVERALAANGVTNTWLEGEAQLVTTLAKGHLAVVMLDVGATQDEGFGPIGGHWVVAYAMDNEHIYLSNWPYDGRCTWKSFRRAWDTVMTRAFYGAPPWQSHRWFLVPRRPGL
jgi:predicted double-glycine peptidase